jgi:ribonuclease HII
MMKNGTDLLKYEREYAAAGYRLIAGADEAGRGPLAGPVACAAVIMPTDGIIEGVFDSKQVPENKREVLYGLIIQQAVAWSVCLIDHQTIDEINILRAAMRGMETALKALSPAPDVALIDAVKGLNVPFPTVPIIHGDALSYNIAAASIVAKVTRDRLMRRYDTEFPQYGFAAHKGYGTARHYAALAEFGACPIHRKTFLPKEQVTTETE